MGRFGTKNPAWYACVVKADNQDGTIKVKWDDGGKFTKRLPVENFVPDGSNDDEPVDDVPMDIFAMNIGGDY